MTAAASGEPILISVDRYERITGQKIYPEHCIGSINREAFESAFSRYLLWELNSPGACSLRHLEKKTCST